MTDRVSRGDRDAVELYRRRFRQFLRTSYPLKRPPTEIERARNVRMMNNVGSKVKGKIGAPPERRRRPARYRGDGSSPSEARVKAGLLIDTASK